MTKKDIEALERSHPKRYILPMTATQITTMTTYISQVLFGQETPWKVEGRRPEDDVPAELVNNLLRWNAEQQPTYLLGYLWVQDALAVNRGVFYNSWAPIFKPEMVQVPVNDPNDIDSSTGLPRTYMRPTRRNKVVGNFCKMEIVSPYDFICDPALPLHRLGDGRFCGHRTIIPVTELRRRSKLPIDDPSYVLPSAVADLVAKAKKGIAQADAAVPSLPGVLPNPSEIRLSRTAYERTRALQPTGNVQADKNDTGNVECWELWVRLVPSENRIYSDDTPSALSGGKGSPTGAQLNNDAGTDMQNPVVGRNPAASGLPSVARPDQGWPDIVESNVARPGGPPATQGADVNPAANQDFTQPGATEDDPVIFQILIAGGDVLLSMTESTYEHGNYPYSVAEGRPNAHFQFSVSWVQMLKGIQDYVDFLKNRHQEALSRTLGNIFVYDPTAVDVTDFMNPDKEGLLITLKPEAAGKKINEIFQQVPIKDMTENFLEEAMSFVKYSQSVTAADEGMQGVMPGGEPASATQFAGTQQMGAGRMTSIARLLSSQALVPQTRMMVSMFQQFMDGKQTVRFKPSNPMDLPPELQDAAAVDLSKDAIAGEYEFPAHDGTLPGTDARKVAAITRLLEAAQGFPQCFTPEPGNINPKKLLLVGAKASGLQIENFLYDKGSLPPVPPAGVPGQPSVAGTPPSPLAPTLPPAPTIPQNPGPKPALPTLSPLAPAVLPPIGPTQPRPGIV